MISQKPVVIQDYAIIFTTRDDYRMSMVFSTSSFPYAKLPKIRTKGIKLLLYNSYSNLFYATAELDEIEPLSLETRKKLSANFPNAYSSIWKHNINLANLKPIKNKFSLEDLNYLSRSVNKQHGYTLDKKGTIMYMDNIDYGVLANNYGI